MTGFSKRSSVWRGKALRCMLIILAAISACLIPDNVTQARGRLFRRRCCCQPAQPGYCPTATVDYVAVGSYCPKYGGFAAGDVYMYYGMKYVGLLSPCEGPPRPLYYESQLLFPGCPSLHCVDLESNGPRMLRATASGPEAANVFGKLACDKGFNKNKPVPANVSATPDQYKRTFKDKDGKEYKLHLFKVDLVLGGVTFPDIGHGYGPRHGDMDDYPLVEDVEFKKDDDSFCGHVKWADTPGGPVIHYDVILNKN